MILDWRRFTKHTEARQGFRDVSCVYVQTDPSAKPLRVGKASKGLEARYRGGTGYALDAAMDGSGNLFYAACVPADIVKEVEDELIWQGRKVLVHNSQGKRRAPSVRYHLEHRGATPDFSDFDTGGG